MMYPVAARRKLAIGKATHIDSRGGGTGDSHCSTVPLTIKPAAATMPQKGPTTKKSMKEKKET